jgi:MoaA/NifB/PqqE/SkfB family radical SAM enzyme
MLNMSTFCALPWMHVFADEQGALYPCCRSAVTKLPNVRPDGSAYRIFDEDGLIEGWNSAYMRELRAQMLRGERPKPCERCYFYEDLGVSSHRQSQNRQHRHRIRSLVEQTSGDGAAPAAFWSFDIRLGNTCNLMCRMCSPQSSKALLAEWAGAYRVEVSHPALDGYAHGDWSDTPGFWSVAARYSHQIERLHFGGGEPFLIESMFSFLQKLVDSGDAARIALSYNTNLTLLPERVFRLWPQFRAVRVTASVDGIGAVNEFIRYPSRWKRIAANLRALDTRKADLNLSGGIGVNTTVQALNVLSVGELLDYFGGEFEAIEAPNLSILTLPSHFSAMVLPHRLRQEAGQRLKTYLDRPEAQWPARWRGQQVRDLRSAISGIVTHIAAEAPPDARAEFVRWIRHQDSCRHQDVCQDLPELSCMFP